MKSVLTKSQKRSWTRSYTEGGTSYRITVTARYDDECNNGHNTFAITADIYEKRRNGRLYWSSGGCCHEEIAKHFPSLSHLIKWHLCDSTGPMYYIANTVFLAGNRDCWGLLKGEEKAWNEYLVFNGFPMSFKYEREFCGWLKTNPTELDIVAVPHEVERDGYKYPDKYTFKGYPVTEWYKCPFDDLREAEEFREAMKLGYTFKRVCTGWGEGKERELDAARSTAIWPDATDDDLIAPGLEERLKARLPGLMEEFKRDIESLGFVF